MSQVVKTDEELLQNGLTDFFGLVSAQSMLQGAQLSQTDTLYINCRWYLISNNRNLLNQAYVEHGIIQTLVDQPVDDGFRSGFEIKTSQLSPEQIEELEIYIEKNQVVQTITQTLKWARLFGGGAILLITSQDPRTPFKMDEINKFTKIEFRAVDMWELYADVVQGENGARLEDVEQSYYTYNGQQIHPSRVYKIKGKEAPSLVRQRLRGWGMSELEKLMRSLNQYLKNQDVIFELLDEAKIDVYKIKGFNKSLLNRDGTTAIGTRVSFANKIKNYLQALVMDSEDDYAQKQITFTGLAEMLVQIRQGIAADLKMPLTKIFGMSAAGFNSGEDDIENYNSMIEGEVRAKSKFVVCDLVLICCQKLFGIMPTDLKIAFEPLRILNAEQEQKVKDSEFNRTMSAYQSGLVETLETKQSINKGDLLPIKIDENLEAQQPIQGDYTTAGENV